MRDNVLEVNRSSQTCLLHIGSMFQEFEDVLEVESDCCQSILLLHIASMFHKLWKMGLSSR
jgi:hypothetical protein